MANEPTPASASSPHGPGRVLDDAEPTRHGRARRSLDPWAFPRSIGYAVLSAVIPGAGLMRTRWRAAGVLMLLALGLLISIGGLLWVFARDLLVAWAVTPEVLSVLWIVVVVAGVVWAASVIVTHLSLRPRPPTGWQRLLGASVVGLLVLTVTAPSFVAARTIHDTRALIEGVFTEDSPNSPRPTFGNPIDPWANKPRLNVLVLGGDSGQSRAEELGARTDTVILASIDTRTGATTLFSLPRQTQRIPFPEGSPLAERWPNGFPDLLNALYHSVEGQAPDALPTGVRDPAAEVLKQAVGTALGVEVDYYAFVDMDGFIEFINALGGITVNINRPVAVGGVTSTNTPPDRWLPPGPNQHLDGNDALWFARGRYGEDTGDYARMVRQRCVIQAVIRQASPTRVLANYESLTKAGRRIVATDVPNSQLPAFVTLAMRVKDASLTSVSFQHNVDGFSTVRPDWDLVRQRVQTALTPPTPSPIPAATASGDPTPAPTGELPPTDPDATPSPSPAAVVDECAYQPEPRPTPEPDR